nr:MAG: capsid protein [Chemarfal virus 231]
MTTVIGNDSCRVLTCEIPCPAKLLYSSVVDQWPSNFAPFFCLGYVQPDGNASPDTLITRVACSWVSHLDFEDA